MDVEFDKEIDALLRKSVPGEAAGSARSAHLDADEIASFAENALPESTRNFYIAHLADCERCRTVLSQSILLRPEAQIAAAPSGAIMQTAPMPWYRRMLSGPSLAYVMGTLVLLFSGFLGYVVLQRSPASTGSDVSQVSEQAPSAAANYGAVPSATVAANSNTADQSSNTSGIPKPANVAGPQGTSEIKTLPGAGGPVVKSADEDAAINGTTGTSPPPPPPAPTDAVAAPKVELDDKVAQERPKDQPEVGEDETRAREAKKRSENKLMKESPAPAKSVIGGALMAGRADAASKDKAQLSKNDAFATRRIGNRSFTKKDGVWYDAAFHGQPTINIRRGTEDYRRLDGGLRSIAESLGGTVVTVWKEKAYRIQ
jgi:hypothetical protein